MPCLNEAETLEICISKAKKWADKQSSKVEILIADNGSNDGSQLIARNLGARVIDVPKKGYGAALDAGIKAASFDFVVMADADDSYDFSKLDSFKDALISGADLVIGNRFSGGIEAGAMPWKNRYIGNPVLSWLGRKLFKIKIRDFHCGIRAVNKKTYLNLGVKTSGMEYATEMVIRFAKLGLRIVEVPTTLSKDGRNRPPHLRPWRDGWRHLKFMILLSPRAFFMLPGLFIATFSLGLFSMLSLGPINLGFIQISTYSFLYSLSGVVLGLQLLLLGTIVQLHFETSEINSSNQMKKLLTLRKLFTGELVVEKGILLSSILVGIGIVVGFYAFNFWVESGFNELPNSLLIQVGWSIMLIISGVEFLFASLVANYLLESK